MRQAWGVILLFLISCSHVSSKPASVKPQAKISQSKTAQSKVRQNVKPQDVSSDPNLAQTKSDYEKGLQLLNANHLTEAAKSFDQAIARGGRYALPYHGRGLVSYREGKYKEASSYFSKAISIKPNFSPAFHGLALSQRNLGQFDESEQAYLAAIKYDKNNPIYHYNLGILYDVYMGKPDKALKAYQEYLKVAGSGAEKKVEKWVELIEKK